MIKYTKYNNIIRGSRWPPGFSYSYLTIDPTTGGFPTSASTAWAWKMEFGEDDAPTAFLSVTAAAVSYEGGSIRLALSLTDDEAEELEEGTKRVEIVSYDETGQRSVYGQATGQAKVIGNWE